MIKQYTKPTRAKDIVRKWHIVDLKGKILGRAATDIAAKLIGKNK
ncbi:MAG: 50S ribosomal protein L13, partial [Candidatus Gottesmanbacteria bacterium GW2011_GWA2_42_18]